MNSFQQFQTVFDSVCRCFGHTPVNSDGPTLGSTVDSPPRTSPRTTSLAAESPAGSSTSMKRRANRLGLQDKQWDELFEKQQPPQPPKKKQPQKELTSAEAMAQAKLAANPPRYAPSQGPNTTRSKRKRSSKAPPEEIFRNKDKATTSGGKGTANAKGTMPGTTPFSRLFQHPSLAMCFATPIRESAEDDMDDIRSVDNSDAGTLNTCEDTITSTVFYENKISHLQETQPPMPLFHQYKIGQSKDEIRNIVASDSHSSVHMMRLMQQERQTAAANVTPNTQKRRSGPDQRSIPDEEMEEVPDVKAVSDSSDSSVRQSKQAPTHS